MKYFNEPDSPELSRNIYEDDVNVRSALLIFLCCLIESKIMETMNCSVFIFSTRSHLVISVLRDPVAYLFQLLTEVKVIHKN